jgi:iron-sulfur cluster assembly protein
MTEYFNESHKMWVAHPKKLIYSINKYQNKGGINLKVYTVSLRSLNSTMTSATPSVTKQSSQKGIQMSETALAHVLQLRQKQGKDLCLRVGVRQGGCSGMSYMMDFEDIHNIRSDDEVYDYEGFKVVCDRKSILYLYGLVLDYSDAMIGGGFQFTNPNATQSCGCGKSFST